MSVPKKSAKKSPKKSPTEKKAPSPAAIIARGDDLGYTDICATRDGGVEWIEPPNHETDDAWERSVKRNLDAVVAYLRAEEKARKAAEKRVARKSSEPVPRVEASEDLRRLRALWREMGDVLDRLEARP